MALLSGANIVRAQDTTVSAGVNFRAVSGTFGSSQTTRAVYAPASLRVDTGRFELTGFFPFVSVSNGTVLWSQGGFIPMQGTMTGSPHAGAPMTAGGVMGGMMGTPQTPGSIITPDAGTPVVISQSGLGDIVGGVGYRLVDRRDGLQLVVGTRVKIPTASAATGLGTGRVDIAATATVRRRLMGAWVYLDGGFVRVGSPAGITLNNAVLWGAGGGRQLRPRVFVLGSASGSTAIVADFGPSVEISGGLGFKLSERASVTVMPLVGLTMASPRFGITVGISNDMLRR